MSHSQKIIKIDVLKQAYNQGKWTQTTIMYYVNLFFIHEFYTYMTVYLKSINGIEELWNKYDNLLYYN